MPSGYTHLVQIGEITELNDFVRKCAPAFFFRAHEIPEYESEEDGYHAKALIEAVAELEAFGWMTDEEIADKIADSYQADVQYEENAIAERNAYRVRYEAMLEKVKAWDNHPDLQNLKNFMIEQLESSIDWDCSISYYEDNAPVLLPVEEYRIIHKQYLENNVEYHTEHRAKEVEEIREKNAFIKTVLESLDNC